MTRKQKNSSEEKMQQNGLHTNNEKDGDDVKERENAKTEDASGENASVSVSASATATATASSSTGASANKNANAIDKTETRKKFLINFFYFILLFAISVILVRYCLGALMPFIIALAVALLLKPLVKFFTDKCHLNRNVTSVVLVVLFYSTIGVIAVLLTIELVQYLGTLISKLPTFYTQTIVPALYALRDAVEELVANIDTGGTISLDDSVDKLIGSLGTAITNFSGTIIGKAGNVAAGVPSMLLNIIITIISTAFLLMDFDTILSFFKHQIPKAKSDLMHTVTGHLGKVLRQYILSYALIMIITFGEIWLGLTIIGIKNSVAIAGLVAVFDILPIVGSGMVMLPWAVITLIIGDAGQGIGLLILWAVIIIIRNIIEPKIVGSNVGMHPLLTLFAMIAGSFIYGGVGILLLPVSLALCQSLNYSGVLHIYNATPGKGEKKEGKLSRLLNSGVDKLWAAIAGFFRRLFAKRKKKIKKDENANDKGNRTDKGDGADVG